MKLIFVLARTLKKTLGLTSHPLTEVKKSRLKEVFSKFRWCCSNIWDCIEYWDEIPKSEKREALTSSNLHHLTYHYQREVTNLPANIVQTARRQVYDLKKSGRVGNIPIRFDNRIFSFRITNKGNPVITIATDNGRLAIPIAPNRLWDRFNKHLRNEWRCNSIMINFKNNSITIQPVLTKEVVLRSEYNTVLGVDVNVGNFAAITVYDPIRHEPLRQLYFGQDIVGKIRDIEIRRSKLQSHSNKSAKARKKLERLKGYETMFVKTRCYQITHKIVDIAKQNNSVIAIEDIKHIRDNVNFGRRINRKFHRWAFRMFFDILEQVANQERIAVPEVDAVYTSQRCSRCGYISKSNRRNWHLFKCRKCGFEVNPDRNASVNISKKLFSVRGQYLPQTTENGMVVAPSVCSNEGISS